MENNKELIKTIREKTGLSRKDFCNKYGIPYQTMTDWELGHRTPPDYLVRYMAYYTALKNVDRLIDVEPFQVIGEEKYAEGYADGKAESIKIIKQLAEEGTIPEETSQLVIDLLNNRP